MNRSRPPLLLGLALLVGVGVAIGYAWIARQDDAGSPGFEQPPREAPGGEAGASGARATRSESSQARARVDENAKAPSRTRFRVVDRNTAAPLFGVNLRATESGEVLATTDEQGMAAVTGRPPSRIVFEAPGYLRALVERTVAEPRRAAAIVVRLWRDRFTVPFAVRFVSSSGAPPRAVRMRLECLEEPPPSGGSVPRVRDLGLAVDHDLREAWRRHALLCSLPGSFGELYHLGLDDAQRIYEVGSSALVRLVATGAYLLEARSSDDEVARVTLRVGPGGGEPFVVHLRPGAVLRGVVRDPRGAGVAGAHVSLDPPGIGASHTQTGPDGKFALGPLTGAPVVVHVDHAGYEPARMGPRRPGGGPLVVVLRPRAAVVVRGVVRARPRLRPVAGARVQLRSEGRVLASARTGPDGRFELRGAAEAPELVVEAQGFMRYVEALEGEDLPATFDLLPASPQARVEEGMTGLVSGVVVGPDGRPREGVAVLVVPQRDPGLHGIAGRRILEGGVLMLPHRAISGPRGEFRIECLAAGPARAVAADGVSRVEDGAFVQVTPGVRREGVVVRAAH